MTVKVKIPTIRGHDTQILSVEEAKGMADEYLKSDTWFSVVNGKVVAKDELDIKDGDEVTLLPQVRGG